MALSKTNSWMFTLLLMILLSACNDSNNEQLTSPKEVELQEHQVLEGDSGTSNLTLQFISPIDGQISYQSFNITAAEKSDYSAIDGNLTVIEGEKYSLDVTVFGDEEIEGTERFGIKLTDSKGVVVDTLYGEIINDDLPKVQVSSPEVTEQDTGVSIMTFTVTLTDEVVDDYVLTLKSVMPEELSEDQITSYSAYIATPASDYQEVNQEIIFESGQKQKSLKIEVISENIIEEDEFVLIRVSDETGENVLDSPFAHGVIRSDETSTLNGFRFENSELTLSNFNEGTDVFNGEAQWVKMSLVFPVKYAQNIKEQQNLRFTILPFDTSKILGLVEESTTPKENYINTTDLPDICFNTGGEIENDGCQLQLDYVLTPDTEQVGVDLYVYSDDIRELDEEYFINIGNDQGVSFLNVPGSIRNDDAEKLLIQVDGEYIDLESFTQGANAKSNKNIYMVSEPTENEIDININLRIDTTLQTSYDLTYSVQQHYKYQPAKPTTDFSAVSENVITFSKTAQSPVIESLPITLKSDGNYDGDKFIEVVFKNTDITPLIIKISDSDNPDVEVTHGNGSTIDDFVNDLEKYEIEPEENSDQAINIGYSRSRYALSMDSSDYALSDIEYTVSIERIVDVALGESIADASNACISQGRENLVAQPNFDDTLDEDIQIWDLNNDIQLNHGDSFKITSGSTRAEWELRIQDDNKIECIEKFKVMFTPVNNNNDNKSIASIIFTIKDTDKANITVNGWEAEEGDEDHTENFLISSDRDVISDITVTLSGSGEYCKSGSDITTELASEIGFSPDALTAYFEVGIKGDKTVEPNEECRLSIGDINSNIVNVLYRDESGSSVESYAPGWILNDDKLDISFEVSQEKEPAEKDSPSVALGILHWSTNQIASNVDESIELTFSNAACDNEEFDCIEFSEIAGEESDIKFIGDGVTETIALNNIPFDDDKNRYEVDLPILILADNVVENTEVIKISITSDSGVKYINSFPSIITSDVINEDKLSIVFNEISPEPPLNLTNNGSEFGSRYYEISWGDKSVAESVPALTYMINDNDVLPPLHQSGVATRKISGAQEEFDYELILEGENFYAREFSLKSENKALPSGGSLKLELSLNDDDLIEEIELIQITLPDLYDEYFSSASSKQTHEISIVDQLLVTVTPPSNNSEFTINENEDEAAFKYEVSVFANDIDPDVPDLKIGIVNSGDANSDSVGLVTSDVKDYTFTTNAGSSYSGNELSLYKQASNSLIVSPTVVSYLINNDNHVEKTESIITSFINTSSVSDYIKLDGPGVDADTGNIVLTHYIINDDKTNFSITQVDTSQTSPEEGEGIPLKPITKTYKINWDNPIGKGIGSNDLKFDLPFTGSATKNSDYTLTAKDTNILTISDFEISSDPQVFVERLTVNKDVDSVLLPGSVFLDVKILDDDEVEGDEIVTASFKSLEESFPDSYQDLSYLTFSNTENSFSHTITSEEGVIFSLERINAMDTSFERDEITNTYKLSWSDDIGVGVANIPLELNFSGDASRDVDYVVVSSDSDKLSINNNGNTFTIKKETDQVLGAGFVEFKVEILDDDDSGSINYQLVEPEETYSITLNVDTYTPSFITISSLDFMVSHTIKIDESSDKTDLSISHFSDNRSEYTEGGDSQIIWYELNWTNPIAENVPGMSVNIILDEANALVGAASTDDFNVYPWEDNQTELTINGNQFTFKEMGESLGKNRSVWIAYEVKNDNLVEREETISGKLGVLDDENTLLNYARIDEENDTLKPYKIKNIDKLTLSLIPDDLNPTSSVEDVNQTLNFSFSWDKPVAYDVPALSVMLDPSGEASVDDYTIATSSGLSVDTNDGGTKKIYTFKGDGVPLSINEDTGLGSVDFSFTIFNDANVEEDELLSSTLGNVNTDYVTIHETKKTLSHTINSDGDKLPITITRVPLPEGDSDSSDEDSWNTKSYTISWPDNVSVSEYVPELTLNFDLTGSTAAEDTDGNPAVASDDYVVSFSGGATRSESVVTLKSVGAALSAGGSYQFSFDVHNDDLVEIDETISAEFSVVDTDGDSANGIVNDYVVLSSGGSIAHNIESEDSTALSIVPAPNDPVLTTATSEEAAITRTYNLVSSKAVAQNVGEIKAKLDITGTATRDTDYAFTAENLDASSHFTIHPYPATGVTASGVITSFSITTKTDSIIEYDESFEATLATTLISGADYASVDSSNNTVTHTIQNDDFINVWLDEYDSMLGFSEGDSINFNWDYTDLTLSQDITMPLELALTGIGDDPATTADYTKPNASATLSTADSVKTGSTQAFSVVDDTIVEVDEAIQATLSISEALTNASQIIKLRSPLTAAEKTVFDYTISDNDFITPIVNNIVTEGSTNGTWTATLCLPENGYTLASNATYNLSILNTSTAVDTQQALVTANSSNALAEYPLINKSGFNNSYQNAVCDTDYFAADATSCSAVESTGISVSILATDFNASNNCITKNLLTIKGNKISEINKHIQYNLSASDARGFDIDKQQLVIVNDDYQLTIDTGVDKCVDSNRNLRVCGSGSGNPEDAYDAKQDASATTGKTELAYTGITKLGLPTFATMGGTGAAPSIAYGNEDDPEECFQDNNTGFIWTKTQYDSATGDAILNDQGANIIADTELCGIAKSDWSIPNVQDLYSVMVMKHLRVKNGNPNQTMRSSSAYQTDAVTTVTYGDGSTSELTSHYKSAYWSSDVCDTGSYWTVDFFTGLTRCEKNDATNYKIMVYKP